MKAQLITILFFFCVFITTRSETDFLQSAKSIEPWIIKLRRELHQIPELQFDLPKTSKSVRNVLEELDIPYKFPVAMSGIVAEIGTGTPVVGLRADMDALPIQEPQGLDFVSKHEGKMHACGHDAHTAMLLGAARLLKEQEGSFTGKVRLVFQPAEEIGTGARAMIKEGVLDDLSVMFGFHIWPRLEMGKIATKAGVISAGMNFFEVTVRGKGGHAAMPAGAIDPFIPVANMILAYQTILSRTMDPQEAHVISVTKIKGGHAFNVIPDSIEFGGTMRSLEIDGLERLTKKFKELTNGIAESFDCKAEVKVESSLAAVVNDAEAAEFAKQTASTLLGEDQVLEAVASLGSEDFAYYGQKVPSAFVVLGIQNETKELSGGLHNSRFMLDEEVLHIGAALHTSLALEYLAKHSTKHYQKAEL